MAFSTMSGGILTPGTGDDGASSDCLGKMTAPLDAAWVAACEGWGCGRFSVDVDVCELDEEGEGAVVAACLGRMRSAAMGDFVMAVPLGLTALIGSLMCARRRAVDALGLKTYELEYVAKICASSSRKMAKKLTIGARLRQERERLSFSQEGFAEVAGSTKRTQLNHEQGVGTPTAAALAAWAVVGLDVLYVVTGERDGQAPPPPPSPEEQTLLAYWRDASKEVRGAALGALVGVGKLKQDRAADKPAQGKVVRLVAVKKPDPKR